MNSEHQFTEGSHVMNTQVNDSSRQNQRGEFQQRNESISTNGKYSREIGTPQLNPEKRGGNRSRDHKSMTGNMERVVNEKQDRKDLQEKHNSELVRSGNFKGFIEESPDDGSGDTVFTKHDENSKSRRSIRLHDGIPVGEDYFMDDERGNGKIKTKDNMMIELNEQRSKVYLGEYVFIDNEFYRHGRGEEYDPSNDNTKIYVGDFRMGYYHGNGTLYRDGVKYFSGNWYYGHPKGSGKLFDEDGIAVRFQGEWNEGYCDDIDYEIGDRRKKKTCFCFLPNNPRAKEIKRRKNEWKRMKNESVFVTYKEVPYNIFHDKKRTSVKFQQASDHSIVRGSAKIDKMSPIDAGICKFALYDDTTIENGNSMYTGQFNYEKEGISPNGKGEVTYGKNIVMEGIFKDGKLIRGKIVMWKIDENDNCECKCICKGNFGEGLPWACYPEIEKMVHSEGNHFGENGYSQTHTAYSGKLSYQPEKEWKQIQNCLSDCEFKIIRTITSSGDEFIGKTPNWSMNYQEQWNPYKHKKNGKLYYYGIMNKKCHKNGYGREYDEEDGILVYVGEFKDDCRHGEGYILSSSERKKCYFGRWENGKQISEKESKEAQSLLTRYYADRPVDELQFVRIGNCVEKWPNHPIIEYVGFVDREGRRVVGCTYYYKKDERTGQYSEIRCLYEGCFENEKYHRKGKLFINHVYTFEGEFDKGDMVRGLICLNRIPIYEGDVNPKGEMHGKGTLFYQTPLKKKEKVVLADGIFQNGKLHGSAVIYYNPSELNTSTGMAKYIGQFEMGEMHGKGVWIGQNQTYVIGIRKCEDVAKVIEETEKFAKNQESKWEENDMIVNCWNSGYLSGKVPILINSAWYEVEFEKDQPIRLTFVTKDGITVCSDVQKVEEGGIDIGFMHVQFVGMSEITKEKTVYSMQTSDWMPSSQLEGSWHSIVLDGNFKKATRRQVDGQGEFTGEFMNWEPVRTEHQGNGICREEREKVGKDERTCDDSVGEQETSFSEKPTTNEVVSNTDSPVITQSKLSSERAKHIEGETRGPATNTESISDDENDNNTTTLKPSASENRIGISHSMFTGETSILYQSRGASQLQAQFSSPQQSPRMIAKKNPPPPPPPLSSPLSYPLSYPPPPPLSSPPSSPLSSPRPLSYTPPHLQNSQFKSGHIPSPPLLPQSSHNPTSSTYSKHPPPRLSPPPPPRLLHNQQYRSASPPAITGRTGSPTPIGISHSQPVYSSHPNRPRPVVPNIPNVSLNSNRYQILNENENRVDPRL